MLISPMAFRNDLVSAGQPTSWHRPDQNLRRLARLAALDGPPGVRSHPLWLSEVTAAMQPLEPNKM